MAALINLANIHYSHDELVFTYRVRGTGEAVPVAAKRLPYFKVGKELKDLVNRSKQFPIRGGDDDDE